MGSSFTHQLAGFAARPITTTAAARLVSSLSALDWLAVGRAGVNEPVAQVSRNMVLAEKGAPHASIFGSDIQVPARAAALVNGTTSHALDYDDTHFAHIGHPSVAVFPAALAMGELHEVSLVEVLEAALIGMEVSIRVGLWLGRSHYQVGLHQTSSAGAFGAAVAAGRIAGFDAIQMQQVLGLTATRASGLKAQFGTMGKPYNAGMAVANGVEAALLIGQGLQANPDAVDGPGGFGVISHGENNLAEAVQGLGETWVFEEVSHKFHACCHGLHAALEAGRELDVGAPEIAEMTVTTHPRWMSVCNKPAPTTGLGAKFSYTTVLAMQALGHNTAVLDSYRDSICADPRLIALRKRIGVVADDSLSETQAWLSVLRRDGVRQDVEHDLRAPMSLAMREDRVRSKAGTLIGQAVVNEAWEMLRTGGSAAGFARLLNP